LSLSCEGTHSEIIDTLGIPPQITGATLNPSTVNSDTINIAPERKPEDILPYSIVVSATIIHPLGKDHIIEPSVTFGRSSRTLDISTTNLRDDGIFPDLSPGDSVFAGQLQFNLMRSEIGSFYAEASALDAEGYVSNTIRVPFTLLRLNQPPTLSNLLAPDTVFLSGQSSFLITVQATDPDGLSDILSVTRTTPSNLVLFLNDNGTNGDLTSGDGVFAETVSLSPPPQVGSYAFIFKATDRSNATSQVINKTIVVEP
jgi:hypothetical protein